MRLKSPAGPADGATPTPSGDQPTSYRTLSSLVSGGLMVLFGVGLAAGLGIGSEKHPVGVALGVLLIVAGVVGALYPSAKSHADRLEIRNPFRTIEVPWPRVDEVTARLSLVVTTKPDPAAGAGSTGRKFTVWAVPVSMHERRKADRAVAKQTRDARQEAMRQAKQAGQTEALLHGGRGSGPMRGRQHVDVVDSMAFADQAATEMTERKRICDTPIAETPQVRVSWTLWTLGVAAASVLGMVLAVAGTF